VLFSWIAEKWRGSSEISNCSCAVVSGKLRWNRKASQHLIISNTCELVDVPFLYSDDVFMKMRQDCQPPLKHCDYAECLSKTHNFHRQWFCKLWQWKQSQFAVYNELLLPLYCTLPSSRIYCIITDHYFSCRPICHKMLAPTKLCRARMIPAVSCLIFC